MIRRFILIPIPTLLIVSIGGVIHHYLSNYFEKKSHLEIVERYHQVKILEKGVKVLSSWWKDGPFKVGDWSNTCPESLSTGENIDRSYYWCNGAAIECAIKNGKYIEVEYDNNTYELTLNPIFKDRFEKERLYFPIYKSYQAKKNSPLDGAIFELALKNERSVSLRVHLEDVCNNVFLPHRNYALGTKRKEDWMWDNFDRYLYLDRFQVTNQDILEWIAFYEGPMKLLDNVKRKVLAAPATHLNAQQMETFCQVQGKTIMSAEFFDAATFHPHDYESNKKFYIFRSKYPEGGRDSKHFITALLKSSEMKLKKDHCDKLYALECFSRFSFVHHQRASVSWAGLFQVLGGYPEYLKNKVRPSHNLKASSFYLSYSSKYHQLGKRAFWNGEGFTPKDFEGVRFPPIDRPIEIAFRCFRELSYE